MKWLVTVLSSLVITQSAYASENDIRCASDSGSRQTEMEVKQHFEQLGWEFRRIKNEHGCYEIYAIDNKGNRREAYVDPNTLEIIRDDD